MRFVRITLLCVIGSVLLLVPLSAAPPTTPVVTSAIISADGTSLFISGSGFGASPAVTLGGFALGGVVVNSIGTQIIANMPSMAAGSYQLTVQSGSNKSAAFELAVGAQGPEGPTGPAGAAGSTGAPGPAGADGPAGPAGATGANGENGATGPAGANGAVGPTGPAGANGANGADGMMGPTGPAGAQGAQGAQGTQGPQGLQGLTGSAGPAGAIGPTGPQGANGAAGPAGAVGPTGPQGANGAIGPTGPQGANGVAGANGAVGPTGPAGPQGNQGTSGVLALGSFSGGVGTVVLTGGYKFLGPTATLTVSGAQRLTGAASAALGKSAAGDVVVAIGLCYQPSNLSASPTNFAGGNYVAVNFNASNRQPHSASASVAPGAGTYLVGMCADGSITLDSNDYVNGWVMVSQ